MPNPTLDEIRGWPATVSVASAAQALGVSKSWLHLAIKQELLPLRVLHVGRRYRIITAELVRLLEAS
ncbi:helix-turn-helix domain-containing protein [Streptomyces sp. NPDC127051]|uniref:helix-turn-helix domain-containing protein n=1 Tax=Streptomyces sp. NPDC127051 TaxID=3347119 RepID=UPI00364EC16F